MFEYIKNKKNDILINILPGKAYITDLENRMNQSAQKGPTCWYYCATPVRPRFGKGVDHLSLIPGIQNDVSVQELLHSRNKEKIISELQKKQTKNTNVDPAEKLKQYENFFLQMKCDNYIQRAEDLYLIDVRELNSTQKQAMLSTLAVNFVYSSYHFSISSWHPLNGLESLLEALKKGPLLVFGSHGKCFYNEPPVISSEQSSHYNIYYWRPGVAHQEHGDIHATLVVGAQKVSNKEYVYFLETNDHSYVNEKRKLYKVSYKRFANSTCNIYNTEKYPDLPRKPFAYYSNLDEQVYADKYKKIVTDALATDNKIDFFHRSVIFGKMHNIEKINFKEIDINTLDKNHNSSLHLALITRNKNMFSTLIDLGASYKIKDKNGYTICDYLINKLNESSTPKLFELECLNHVIQIISDNPNYSIDLNKSARIAASNGELDDLKVMAKCGADLNSACIESKQTALHRATINRHQECINFLIAQGVNEELIDKHGKKASDYKNQQKELPKITTSSNTLFTGSKQSSDINRKLRQFAAHGTTDQLMQILKHPNVDINCRDTNPTKGYTALHLAMQFNRIDNAKLLIDAGASNEISDNCGKFAFDYGSEDSKLEIMMYVCESRLNIN